jgi:hypothetical protein
MVLEAEDDVNLPSVVLLGALRMMSNLDRECSLGSSGYRDKTRRHLQRQHCTKTASLRKKAAFEQYVTMIYSTCLLSFNSPFLSALPGDNPSPAAS